MRAEAPPLSDALRRSDLRAGKANEKMAERLADVEEAVHAARLRQVPAGLREA